MFVPLFQFYEHPPCIVIVINLRAEFTCLGPCPKCILLPELEEKKKSIPPAHNPGKNKTWRTVYRNIKAAYLDIAVYCSKFAAYVKIRIVIV